MVYEKRTACGICTVFRRGCLQLGYDLTGEFIAEVGLPRTSATHSNIRYADSANRLKDLFSRAGWFPATGVAAPKSIYLLFVGTAEAIEKHVPAITDVRARGNDVLVFEFAGQGASGRFLDDPRKVHAGPGGFNMWADSLKEFMRCDLFRAVRQRAYDHKMAFVALPYSLGGHLFARAMQETPALSKRFTHIVYVNPVVAMNSAGSMIVRTGQQLLAGFSVANGGKAEDFVPGHGRFHPGDRPLDKSSIGSDRARHEWICRFYHDNEHLAMWGMTYGWFNEANRSLTKMWGHIAKSETKNPLVHIWAWAKGRNTASQNARLVPTLVISSQKDTIVIAHYVRRFARYIGADVLLLPRAKHEPSQEPQPIREGTFDAVAAWVANPADPKIAISPDVRFMPAKAAHRNSR